jgi:RNA polymerase sigma-70 factor (ECF subfamily)
LVVRARGDTPETRAALSELCEAYYQPVFRFLRCDGRNEEAARECAQDFFARVLERGDIGQADPSRGRFRTYLLGAVKHFLADRRDYERRLKRGGGVQPESLEVLAEETSKEAADAPVPDSYFDRQWALIVMDRALQVVEKEFREGGKADQFSILKPWLVGETETLSQAEAAARLGSSEGAIKVGVHRLRKRFRECIRSEIAQTLESGGDIEAELRYLVEVLTANNN